MKMISMFFLSICISFIHTEEPINIEFNKEYRDSNLSTMKIYSIQIDNNLKDNDLLIDNKSEGSGSFKNSITFLSLIPLPNNNKDKQWVCGQVGSEICLLPNKHLAIGDKIYIGVVCDKCNYSLKVTYIKEQTLKDGETKVLHLKAGDKLVFNLDKSFSSEKNYIKISSFNLKMAKYQMNVQLVDSQSEIKNIDVDSTWIGGQQAKIIPTGGDYKVLLNAIEDGVITIEASTSSSIVNLDDKNMRFDSLKEGENLCYRYQSNDDTSSVIIQGRSIKGDITFDIKPENSTESITLNIPSEKDAQYELTPSIRKEKGMLNGNWLICVNSKTNAYFTLHAYLANNIELVKEFKKILYKLARGEETYNIDNLLIKDSKKEDMAPIRLLLQQNQTTSSNENKGISINGAGVAGIASFLIFIITVILGTMALSSIFVNTKFVDTPLLLGKIEY